MNSSPTPPPWLGPVRWVPIACYFLVKYVVIGRDNITSQQTYLLIGFVVLAEIALWQYRKKFRKPQNENRDGTD